jgi:hypothetical protein
MSFEIACLVMFSFCLFRSAFYSCLYLGFVPSVWSCVPGTSHSMFFPGSYEKLLCYLIMSSMCHVICSICIHVAAFVAMIQPSVETERRYLQKYVRFHVSCHLSYLHTCGSICRDDFGPFVETERRLLQKYVCSLWCQAICLCAYMWQHLS